MYQLSPLSNDAVLFSNYLSHTPLPQAGDFLLNWRSEIGKSALTVVVEAFQDELGPNVASDAAIEAAQHLLEDFRFVYGKPDAPVRISLFYPRVVAHIIKLGPFAGWAERLSI